MQETQEKQVWSLSQEDPLEEEMTTEFNILAWKIPWTEEPGELQSMELQRIRQDWTLIHHTLYTPLWILYEDISFCDAGSGMPAVHPQ